MFILWSIVIDINDDRCYLTLSLISSGGELFELLKYRGGNVEGFDFREDMASRLMRDMLSAVHYLHSKVGTRTPNSFRNQSFELMRRGVESNFAWLRAVLGTVGTIRLYNTVHFSSLHFTTLHYTTLQYTQLYYTTLHNSASLSPSGSY